MINPACFVAENATGHTGALLNELSGIVTERAFKVYRQRMLRDCFSLHKAMKNSFQCKWKREKQRWFEKRFIK